MKAALLVDERHIVAVNAFVDLVVWRLGTQISCSRHDYTFSTPERLLEDFWSEVERWRF